jgi:WD40 repeat protein
LGVEPTAAAVRQDVFQQHLNNIADEVEGNGGGNLGDLGDLDQDLGELNPEDVKAVVHKALLKMKLAEQHQQDKDHNSFAVVLACEAAGKPDFHMGAAGRRERAFTGLLVVGCDLLSLISTFLSWGKVELQREWEVPGGERVFECHISPCSSMVLTASGNDLHLWDAASGLLKNTLKGHTSTVTGCRFFPDGKTAVSTSLDRTLKVWDVKSGSLDRTLVGHTNFVSCVDVSPDNARILSGSLDSTWKLWNFRTGEHQHTKEMDGLPYYTKQMDDLPYCCSFSPNGRLLLVGCGYNLKLYDSTTFQLQHILSNMLTGHWTHRLRRFVGSCSFTPDGTTVLSGSEDGTMKLWSTATGQCLRNLRGHSSPVNSCFFSPSGHEICSASEDGSPMVWTTGTGQFKGAFDADPTARPSICASSNGKCIVSGHANGILKMWRVRTGWGTQ